MRETVPSRVADGRAMIGLPSRLRAAPRMKSVCPQIRCRNAPDGVRTNLSGQVHLDRRADGDHPVIACDLERVVGELGRTKLERRIVGEVVVEGPGAKAEAGDNLARQERLAGTVEHTGLDEGHDGLGEHFGVHPQIPLTDQRPEHRAGNGADAGLQRGPVGHQGLDEFGNPLRLGRLRF